MGVRCAGSGRPQFSHTVAPSRQVVKPQVGHRMVANPPCSGFRWRSVSLALWAILLCLARVLSTTLGERADASTTSPQSAHPRATTQETGTQYTAEDAEDAEAERGSEPQRAHLCATTQWGGGLSRARTRAPRRSGAGQRVA